MSRPILKERSERGATSVLIIGFFLVVGLLVAVAVDASAAYLQRQGLANLADGAALAAADGAKAEQAYAGALNGPVDETAARRYAEAYLAASHARGRYRGLALDVRVDGTTVVVTVRAPLDLPLAPPDWEDRPVIGASAAAYVMIDD